MDQWRGMNCSALSIPANLTVTQDWALAWPRLNDLLAAPAALRGGALAL